MALAFSISDPQRHYALQTKRLLLSRVMAEDIDLYQQLLSCPQTTSFLPRQAPYQQSDIVRTLENRLSHWKKYGFGSFTIVDKTSYQKLGYVGVEVVSGNSRYVDIRYALLPEFTGSGLALEAAKACIDFTLALGLHTTIYGVAMQQNAASIRLLENLGMQPCDRLGIETPQLYDGGDLVTLALTRGFSGLNW